MSNAVDLNGLRMVFNSGLALPVTQAAAVPEPSTATLGLLGASATVCLLVRHRRRGRGWLTRRASLLTFWVFTLWAPNSAQADQIYSFSRLVGRGDTIDGKKLTGITFNGRSAFNDLGIVAFNGTFFDPTLTTGIFTQNDLLVKSGDTIGGITLPNVAASVPVINNSGTVAFHSGFFGGNGVFTQNSLIAASGQTIGGKTLGLSLSQPSLNDAGTVLFRATFSGGSGVFTQSDLLVKSGDTIAGKQLFGVNNPPTATLNDSGDIAFVGLFSGGQGLFTQDSLLVKTGDTIDGRTLPSFAFSIGHLSMNDLGDVAFRAELPGSGAFTKGAIFTQNTFIAAQDELFDGKMLGAVSDRPVINDAGEVAFSANFTGGAGIFTKSGGLVVALGDTIDGKTVTSVSNPALNNHGQIAFLVNGSDIYVASSVVPEPSSFVLLAMGVLGVMVPTWRRMRYALDPASGKDAPGKCAKKLFRVGTFWNIRSARLGQHVVDG